MKMETPQKELGGLFHVSQPDRGCKHKADSLDCSRFPVEAPHDWDLEEVTLTSLLPLERGSWKCIRDGELP